MNLIASKSQLRASFARWALFFVPLILLLGSLSGQLGSADTAWFAGLRKPEIFPPPAVFGIAWSVLFVLIGFALAVIASALGAHGRKLALALFALHFVGTLAWTPVFFGLQEMRLGLWVLAYVVLSLFVVVIMFGRVRKLAALLLLPYLGWVTFAAVLNYQFILANPGGGQPRETGAITRAPL